MTWFDAVPSFLAALALVFLPGLVLARTLGARGITWLAVSAPLSASLIGVGAIIAQMLHVRWTPLALVLITLAVSAVAWLIRYFVELRRSREKSPLWVHSPKATVAGLLGGLGFGALILGWRMTRVFIAPENISQTYDNVFHLNAVRFILDTGNGSSLHLATLDPSGPGSFYPAVWHDLVSLVVQLSGSSIPLGLNALNLVLGAFVWTISAMYLATRVLGSRPAVYLVTGSLAGAFGAFPYLLLEFGVLYPNFLAITLLPVAIALISDVLRVSTVSHPGWLRGGILLLAILPGVALSHPSIVIVLGAFAIPIIAFWLYRQCRACLNHDLAIRWLAASLVATFGYLLVLKFVWDKFRPSEKASFWPPRQTIAQALGEGLANAPLGSPIPWTITLLTLLGIYGLLRSRKHLWLLGLLLVGIGLFVVVSGFIKGELRSSLTGVFYNDSYRLAALLPVVGIVVAVYGTIWIFDLFCMKIRMSPKLHTQNRWVAVMIAGTLAVFGLGVLAQDNTVDNAVNRARSIYTITASAHLLSTDEAALIARADETIPADATVLVNPSTGASLVYALEDRRVLLPAVSSTPGPQESILINHLSELESNPDVCAAIRSLETYYVLDFGSKQINEMNTPFPTSEQMSTTRGLTLVDKEGPARLYRVDGC